MRRLTARIGAQPRHLMTSVMGATSRWNSTTAGAADAPQEPEASPPAPSSSVVTSSTSTEDYVSAEEVDSWQSAMVAKYGAKHHLLRPAYFDLMDEIRQDLYTRPPPPRDGWQVDGWKPNDKFVAFRKTATMPSESGGDTSEKATVDAEIVLGAEVKLTDPDKKNGRLNLINWYTFTALIRRNGILMEADLAYLETTLTVRNVKIYPLPEDEKEAAVFMEMSEAGEAKRRLMYDGPYVRHLEENFLQEVYDIVFDYGITAPVARWVCEWVFYLDHVSYTKWSLNLIDHVGGLDDVDDEKDLLTADEKGVLDTEPYDWSEAKRM